MIVLNYAHPLAPEHMQTLGALLGQTIEVRTMQIHIDRTQSMAEAAVQLANLASLTPAEWQTTPLVLSPPGLASLALALVAEVHGRAGYFVPTINIRPVPDSLPLAFEVAEIVNLQVIRDQARRRRQTP